MNKQLFILLVTILMLTNITFAQGAISDFLKDRSKSESASDIETQAQEYFRAIINKDAEGIYKYMSPGYARTMTSEKEAILRGIQDEFELIQKDFKIISIKIKPGFQKSKAQNSVEKIGITVEFATKPNLNESVTMDGELKGIFEDGQWHFFNTKYFLNSLSVPGLAIAGGKEVKGVKQNYAAGVLNAKAISLPAPEFPKAARATGVKGAVNVFVQVDKEGNVILAEAESGHPLLKQAAVDAARQAKFKQLMVDGKPVNFMGTIVYNFTK